MQYPIECVTASYFPWKIIYTARWVIFDPFWPTGYINEWWCWISEEKLFLCPKFQLLRGRGINFREMGNWPFLTPKKPPERVKKNKCRNQIFHEKLCIYANFLLLIVILLEMVNFDPTPPRTPPHPLPLRPPWAKKWPSYEKLLWV